MLHYPGNFILKHNKQIYKCKEKIVILQSIGIITIKVVKQGQSSTPADILVDSVN